MINLEELKPILEPLITGRDDSASIIESIQGIDKEVDVDQAKIDEINKSWNDRYLAAFFGNKRAEILSDGAGVTIEDAPASEIESPAEVAEDPAETVTVDDLTKDYVDTNGGDEPADKKED